MNALDEITRVFSLEIDTLAEVRDSLGPAYGEAVDLIFKCQGKVVATGMGKSGFIAQKIASTMVSTGTPAAFLHPSDGLHGDVGIVTPGDVVLAVSKSGESEELRDLLPYVRKVGVPVISITAYPESTLGQGSKVVLFTPVRKEACPLDLAPTSSTTAAMVVGDALAMTLMKMRGFTPERFAELHPGGQLGKRLLMMVADIMRSGANNPKVNLDDTVQVMLYEMSSKRCGAVSVVGGGDRLVGLVTDGDIRTVLGQKGDIFSLRIQDIMNPSPTFIHSDEKAFDALTIMERRDRPFLVLPVLDRSDCKVVGMVHLHDLVAKGL